jgi:hypothetical protein
MRDRSVPELYCLDSGLQVGLVRIDGMWRNRLFAVSVRMARLTGRARNSISGKGINRIHLRVPR